MGAFLGSAVFSAAVFFYCLGLIFGVVGYFGDWLEPRHSGLDTLSVGIRNACFRKRVFDDDPNKKEFQGCVDTTKTSQEFIDIPKEYVSPDWYRLIQDMYLASLILIFLTLILVIGFLIAYCTLKQQIKSRQRPSSTLLLSKAVLALWFILTAIAGSLLIVAPALFFKNYEAGDKLFLTDKEDFKYGAGFAITIAGGASLLMSTLLELVVFITIVKKMHRLSSGDAKMVFTDEFDNLDANDTEMERLSNDDLDNNGADSSSHVTHKKAYPVAAPRKPLSSDESEPEKSYQNIPKQGQTTSYEDKQTPSTEGGQSYQNIPRPRPKSSAGAPQPAKRLSTHGQPKASTGADSVGYKADYYGEKTKAPGARSIAGESMASTAYPPSTAYAPSTASPSYAAYPQNRHLYNDDTESQQSGGRNRTVTRAMGAVDNMSSASSNIPPPTVVQPGRPADVKHSRYTAMY